MKSYEYIPQGVCSRKMIFEIENNVINDVQIVGGCPGNTLGVSILVKGHEIDEVIEKLKNIKCGFKPTSCPAELAKGLEKYKEENNL